jgi:hypothetical protein
MARRLAGAMADTATYIYCLVEGTRRPAPAKVPLGLPGASRPEIVDVGKSLWGVVADVPLQTYGPDRLPERLRDLAWVADVAVAHESVVEHFAASARGAVVPMKLFTMFSSRDLAVADLRARRAEVAGVLRRIRGCQEWGVRVTLRPRGRPARRAARATTPASGAAFLAEKKRARDDARDSVVKAAEAADSVFRTLARFARSERRREPPENATTPPLLDAAFLVKNDRRSRFRAAAARLAASCRKAGAVLTLTGPWPAYNFVGVDGEPG